MSADRVFTLPDSADATLLTSTSSVGKVLQIVSSVKTDTASASVNRNSDWVGHGLSVSITPSSASNKILIFGQVTVGSSINDGISLSIFTAGSVLAAATGDADGQRKRQTAGAEIDYDFAVTTIPIHYLDTAGGTSSITYQPAFNISIKLVELTKETKDVPIILNNVSMQDDYEGDFRQRRTLMWTLNFTVKTYLFGPVDVQKDIRKVTVDYRSDMVRRPAELRYTAEVESTEEPAVPRDEINPETDPYKVTETYEDIYSQDNDFFGL